VDSLVDNERVTVVGAGLMGHSIALSTAWGGSGVTLYALNKEEASQAEKKIDDKINILAVHSLITEEEKKIIQTRIRIETELETAVQDATLVIEAAPENLELKQQLYKKLETYVGEDTILASNTSSLQPTDIAAETSRPERVMVAHYWNPAHLIPLVEVVQGEKTEQKYIDRIYAFLEKMNKEPIHIKKELMGFVVNRLQYALFREAQFIYESGACSLEDIDRAAEVSIGRRLGVTGPFKTADMGGLDVFHAISGYIFPDLCNDKESLQVMKEKVEKGSYGQKNGEGFYDWSRTDVQSLAEEREAELIKWLQ
jgi:3-hydroxybutyryl-CoA dehydrogenase